MTPDEFEDVLLQGEGISIEFKRCGNLPEADTFETVCSFSNRQGGSIFLGILDAEKSSTGAPEVIGINPGRIVEVERNIANCLNNPKLFNAPPAIEFELITYEGKTILRVWVLVGSVVHRFKGVAYDRVADTDCKVTTDTQLAAMYIRKQEFYSERKVFPFLGIEDLRSDLIDRARRMAVAKRANHPWAEMDEEALLRSASLYLKDYETGKEGYTFAAAMLFGKDDVIASIAPTYKTDAYVQRIDADRYDDRLIVKTNLIESYDLLLEFAQKNLPDKFFLDGTQSISLRDIISRELIANTLMHREYTSPFPAKFVVDAGGIRTENASRPRFVGELNPGSFNPLPKNPIIAEFFNNIGRAESLGSGTRNLFKYSWAYGGGQPILTEGDVFTAWVPIAGTAEAAQKLDVDWTISHMLEAYGYLTITAVAGISGVTERTVRRHVSNMVKVGRLKAVGETRARRYVLTE